MTPPGSLATLIDEADRLPHDGDRLLAASELAEAINQAVLRDPAQLGAIRLAVRDAAAAAGCDLIVGASRAADEVVRSLNAEGTVPTRVLLFDIVRITGAALGQAAADLRHVDVVTAVLLDLGSTPAGLAASESIVLREVTRC
jgi:hypothetical protein